MKKKLFIVGALFYVLYLAWGAVNAVEFGHKVIDKEARQIEMATQ